MRSDQDIERHLEDWLQDKARPIPHNVLEEVLEAVARIPQAGIRSPGWLGNRRAGVLVGAVVVGLAVLAGGLAVDRIGSLVPNPSQSPGPEQIWDPAAELLTAPNQLNPSPDSYGNPGVWSYLRSESAQHDPSRYVPMSSSDADGWSAPGLVNLFVHVDKENGVLNLHPWSDGSIRRDAILAWASPVTGQISIEGGVGRAQSSCEVPTGMMDFSIDRESTTLWSTSLALGESADIGVTTTVTAGETLYFVVDAGPDARCDLTYLGLRILFPAHDEGLTPV